MTGFLIYFAALSVIHLYFCYFRLNKLRMLTKPLLLISLSLFYAFAAKRMEPVVLMALVCGLAGDVLLLWSEKENMFFAGACVFAVGHALYCVKLYGGIAAGQTLGPWGVAAICGAYALIVGMASLSIGRHMRGGAFKRLLPVYLGIVAAVNVGAWLNLISAARSGGDAFGAALALLGAALFLVSDTILARAVFVGDVEHDNFYVMLTYIAAQGCLCFGLADFVP